MLNDVVHEEIQQGQLTQSMPNDVVHEEIQQRQLTQSMPNDVVHKKIQQRLLTQSMPRDVVQEEIQQICHLHFFKANNVPIGFFLALTFLLSPLLSTSWLFSSP